MFDARFSAKEFERLARNDSAALKLLKKDLQDELERKLRAELVAWSRRIVEKLNTTGHQLILARDEDDPDSLDYRDARVTDTGAADNRLRVVIVATGSAGYNDLV
jgi:hypothetical protein